MPKQEPARAAAARRRQRDEDVNSVYRQPGNREGDDDDEEDNSVSPSPSPHRLRSAWKMVGGAGAFSKLKHTLVPIPALKSGEISVDVRAIGLNFADVFSILGLYSATPQGDFIPGLEFAGVVAAIGPDVSSKHNLKVGSRVFGVTRFGAFTTLLNIDAKYVRRLPQTWAFSEGASLLGNAVTAWYALHNLAGIQRGHTCLIHSAAGGTGLWAVRFAQMAGALPIATVGCAEKVPVLVEPRSTGTGVLKSPLMREAVIDRSSAEGSKPAEALGRALDKCYGRQTVDVVFDSLLGDWFHAAFNMLEPMGRHVVLGAASMTPAGDSTNWLTLGWKWLRRPTVDPLQLISMNKSLMCFNLIWLYEKYNLMEQTLDEMLTALGFDIHNPKGVGNPKERPVIGHVFNFENLPDAVRRFQGGKTTGKVVIEVSDAIIYEFEESQ